MTGFLSVAVLGFHLLYTASAETRAWVNRDGKFLIHKYTFKYIYTNGLVTFMYVSGIGNSVVERKHGNSKSLVQPISRVGLVTGSSTSILTIKHPTKRISPSIQLLLMVGLKG